MLSPRTTTRGRRAAGSAGAGAGAGAADPGRSPAGPPTASGPPLQAAIANAAATARQPAAWRPPLLHDVALPGTDLDMAYWTFAALRQFRTSGRGVWLGGRQRLDGQRSRTPTFTHRPGMSTPLTSW